jgi:hypothetical protein
MVVVSGGDQVVFVANGSATGYDVALVTGLVSDSLSH